MASPNVPRRVLMLCADYLEDYEVMVPFQALQAYGIIVDAVCPTKQKGEICRTLFYNRYSLPPIMSYSESRGHDFVLNAAFTNDDVYNKYDGLVIPGGRAPESLALNKQVLDLVGIFSSSGKPIASLCHGSLILASADCLKNVKCTAFPTLKPVLVAAGADWVEADIDQCVVDGKLITAVAYPGHPKYIRSFVKALGGVVSGSCKRILFLCGDFMEDYEIKVPFQTLQALGCHVDAVSPGKTQGYICPTTIIDEFESDWTYIEKPGRQNFNLTATLDEINVASYDGLVIPGGQPPEHLARNEKALRLVKSFMKDNKPVGSISHAPRILAAAHVLEGRKCTGYPLVELNVKLAGGEWEEPESLSHCVTDGNLVSVANWKGHPQFISEFIKLLGIHVSF